MPVPTFTISCTRVTLVARDVYELAFTKPAGFSFAAGRFVLLDIPLPENPADIQPRAYSIASAPDEPEILFLVKLKPGGRTSRWIVETLQPGTDVVMKGPFGIFTLKPDHPEDYLFICTGTGIAPFRSHLLEALGRGDTRRMDLIFGVRTEEDLCWNDLLTDLSQRHQNFFPHVSLSQPSPTWTGHKGRVQTLLPLIAPDMAGKRVYVCGNPDMTKELKELCLAKGVPRERLHIEGFI